MFQNIRLSYVKNILPSKLFVGKIV